MKLLVDYLADRNMVEVDHLVQEDVLQRNRVVGLKDMQVELRDIEPGTALVVVGTEHLETEIKKFIMNQLSSSFVLNSNVEAFTSS